MEITIAHVLFWVGTMFGAAAFLAYTIEDGGRAEILATFRARREDKKYVR